MRIEYPRLPVAFMNDDHSHASDQITTMWTVLPAYPSSREPLVKACRAFIEHNRAHFAREDAAMLASGFPPYQIHKGEHERVLVWLEGLAADIASGQDFDTVRTIVEIEIPAWFVQHVQTMDRVTATWIAAHEPESSVSV